MDRVVIYCATGTNRLGYVLDWLFGERLRLGYSITENKYEAEQAALGIVYGAVSGSCCCIPAHGLLAEKGITEHQPLTGLWEDIPTLFPNNAGDYSLPFDIFSAIFFLLSRYEEYYSYEPDKHGRYPASESILYRSGLLAEPIVDEWVEAFRKWLQHTWRISIEPAAFSFQPSYDIDIAYSHSFKGFGRLAGAYIRALLKGDVQQINERTQVLKKKKTDPYDSFAWLRQLHTSYHHKPKYFILSALRRSAYDRNIHPRHPAMIRIIKQMDKEGGCGIHPSYNATGKELLNKEKNTLEDITGHGVNLSRQHYIRLKIPETCRLLMDCGITDDYSMGYGSQLGFRAGTGCSFLWYDIEREQTTALRIHPFCFMDTTAHYELGLSSEKAFEALSLMAGQLQETNSTLITVFHNFSLGTAREWIGWSEAYQHFLQQQAAIKEKAVA